MAKVEQALDVMNARAKELKDAAHHLREMRVQASMARNAETGAGNRFEAAQKAFDAAVGEYQKAVVNG